VLVDRTAERAVIDRLVDGTRRGASGVLVLRGPAGIGKSALLDYAASRASELAVARIVRWRRWWKPRDGVESHVVTSSGCVAQPGEEAAHAKPCSPVCSEVKALLRNEIDGLVRRC
jgi:hypothetical protein